MQIREMKRQLGIAAISVVMAAIALVSATYAWFVTNSRVHATTSTISAQANGMVLQIAAGKDITHGGDKATVASQQGHEISPSSTDKVTSEWFVPSGWRGMNVSSYKLAGNDETGKYSDGSNDYYAYVAAEYTLYTVNQTGLADVYLDGSDPVEITNAGKGSEAWFKKIQGSLRVGIVIDDELRVVYAPVEPSKTEAGNDEHATIGWSCVAAEGDRTQAPTYRHVFAKTLVDQKNGNWGAGKNGESYVKPTGDAQKIADRVGYNGTDMKVIIWMEGTDSDCVNVSGQDDGAKNPTFNVTVNLVGIVPDSD